MRGQKPFLTRLPTPDPGALGAGAGPPNPERTKQKVVGERVTGSGFKAAPPDWRGSPFPRH